MKAFPTQQAERATIQEQDLAELLGMRSRLLARVRTVKLASADQRLVILAGEPIGVVHRQPGRMLWFSPKRYWPFYSLNDAALNLVGDLVKVAHTDGMPAVWKQVRDARAEAIQLGARIEAMDAQAVET